MKTIDLRSDTVTHPTPDMRKAMADAEVGDDVFRDDPTTNRLEQKAAELLGMEDSLFVSSGTQGNLVALLSHVQRGGEVIIGDKSHIYLNEAGGASALGGIGYNVVSNDSRGMIFPEQIVEAIKTIDVHHARSSLIALENTHNACGGLPLSSSDIDSIGLVAHQNRIPTVSLPFFIRSDRFGLRIRLGPQTYDFPRTLGSTPNSFAVVELRYQAFPELTDQN